MPNVQPNGMITVAVLMLTWCITMLFGILIARATYRAMIRRDTNAFMRVIILNDSLDRIRNSVVNEVATWSTVE
jgi:hypothetical protein